MVKSKEIWKDIEDYPNYQISNMGRVKSLNYHRTGKEKILKYSKNGGGYLFVNLCKNGKEKSYKVHRLVANAFIPNPNNYLQVNHKDENKLNNCVDNLEWCSAKYNINYGTRTDKTKKTILQLTNNDELIKKWDSIKDATFDLRGCKSGCIVECLKGRYKQAYGYKWGYADDYERIPFKVFNLEMYRKKVS